MRASQADVAGDRVLVHLDEATGGAGAATLANVLQEGEGFVLGETGVFQGGALAFRERLLTGAAVDHANTLSFAGPAAVIKVPLATLALLGASRILAAKVVDGVHPGSSRQSNSLPGLYLGSSAIPAYFRNGCLF
jgi:hypothetical protein